MQHTDSHFDFWITARKHTSTSSKLVQGQKGRPPHKHVNAFRHNTPRRSRWRKSPVFNGLWAFSDSRNCGAISGTPVSDVSRLPGSFEATSPVLHNLDKDRVPVVHRRNSLPAIALPSAKAFFEHTCLSTSIRSQHSLMGRTVAVVIDERWSCGDAALTTAIETHLTPGGEDDRLILLYCRPEEVGGQCSIRMAARRKNR